MCQMNVNYVGDIYLMVKVPRINDFTFKICVHVLILYYYHISYHVSISCCDVLDCSDRLITVKSDP